MAATTAAAPSAAGALTKDLVRWANTRHSSDYYFAPVIQQWIWEDYFAGIISTYNGQYLLPVPHLNEVMVNIGFGI